MSLEEQLGIIANAGTPLHFEPRVALLGEGGFGHCVKAKYRTRDGNRAVAVKISKTDNRTERSAADMLGREINVLSSISHDHIVEFIDLGLAQDYSGRTFAYMTLALASHGSLANWLARMEKPFSRIKIMYQILKGVNYLHTRKFYHRDLKPDNILVHRNSRGEYILKITDFGLVTRRELHDEPCGTTLYLDPESYTGTIPYNVPATDVFALGVIMVELLDPNYRIPWKDEKGLVAFLQGQEYLPYAGKQSALVKFFRGTFAPAYRRKSVASLKEMVGDMMDLWVL